MKTIQLRSKEVKTLKEKFPFLTKDNMLTRETEEGTKLYYQNNEIVLAEKEGVTFPTLKSRAVLPQAVVDMGAVKFVTNGADVMAPGVKEKPEYSEEDLLHVVDEKNRKKLAVVQALTSSSEFPEKGRAFKNLHWVGDKIWQQEV